MTGREHLVTTLGAQAAACAALGSPMYGELLERIGADAAHRGADTGFAGAH